MDFGFEGEEPPYPPCQGGKRRGLLLGRGAGLETPPTGVSVYRAGLVGRGLGLLSESRITRRARRARRGFLCKWGFWLGMSGVGNPAYRRALPTSALGKGKRGWKPTPTIGVRL